MRQCGAPSSLTQELNPPEYLYPTPVHYAAEKEKWRPILTMNQGESFVDNATVLDDIGGSSNTESSEMQLKGGWCQGEDGFEKSEMPLEQPGVMNIVEEPGVQSLKASLDKAIFSTGIEAAVLTLSNRISPAEDGDIMVVTSVSRVESTGLSNKSSSRD
ncbi:hypothetical protein OROMI_027772 [Orobanche minor]